MITRDSIQGFIDGLKASGTDISNLDVLVDTWMKNHPTYPQDELSRKRVLDDLSSYRK